MNKKENHKYLISVDIEGITGVISTNFSQSSGKYYELARKYMVSDVNAVVEGIIAADADAQVIVRDAHGSEATNLDLEKLHPRAQLMQGWGDKMNMVLPLDASFTGVFLVGYHAGGQNNQAVLAHTYSSKIHSLVLNGKTVINETGIAAIYAAVYGVPIGFISGDDYAVLEAEKQLGKNIVGVVVKESYGRNCALSLSLAGAQAKLKTGATLATQKLLAHELKPFALIIPFMVAIRFFNIGYFPSPFKTVAGALDFDKTYEFNDEKCTISFKANSLQEMFQRLTLITYLMGLV